MAKLIDETGNRYGRLVVQEKVPNPTKTGTGAYWRCLCDCGQQTIVSAAHLRRGLIQSCGCLATEKRIASNSQNKLIDLTGQRFGRLTVIKRVADKGKQPVWECQCDCGTISYVMGSNLRKENGTRSCGCANSKGELEIAEILTKNNIRYKKEVVFSDCLSSKGQALRFDFGIYDEKDNLLRLIEFNGRQHYEDTGFTSEPLEARQERDNIKINYCKLRNIPLVIIPYFRLGTIKLEDLL